jgi:hypothetical protein
MDSTVDAASLSILKSYIGAKLTFVSSSASTIHRISDSVAISTDRGAFEICGTMTESDFRGFWQQYGSFEVVEVSSRDLPEIAPESARYYQFRDQQIIDISVVRDDWREIELGTVNWNLPIDSSVVIKTESGWVAATKVNYHEEYFSLNFFEGSNYPSVPATLCQFEGDLFKEYALSRSVIELRDESI